MEDIIGDLFIAIITSVVTIFLFSEKVKLEQKRFFEEYKKKILEDK